MKYFILSCVFLVWVVSCNREASPLKHSSAEIKQELQQMCSFTPLDMDGCFINENGKVHSAEGKQFKAGVVINSTQRVSPDMVIAALESIYNVNDLFRDIHFELLEFNYMKGFEDKYYHNTLYGGTSVELEQQNVDTLINVYMLPRLSSHVDPRIAHIFPVADLHYLKYSGLCYWETEYDNDPNTIFLSDEALMNTYTLAHEMGHYFNLNHCNCCSGPEKRPECYKNRMNEVFTYCDAVLTEAQQDTVFSFIPVRECVIYDKNHIFGPK